MDYLFRTWPTGPLVDCENDLTVSVIERARGGQTSTQEALKSSSSITIASSHIITRRLPWRLIGWERGDRLWWLDVRGHDEYYWPWGPSCTGSQGGGQSASGDSVRGTSNKKLTLVVWNIVRELENEIIFHIISQKWDGTSPGYARSQGISSYGNELASSGIPSFHKIQWLLFCPWNILHYNWG